MEKFGAQSNANTRHDVADRRFGFGELDRYIRITERAPRDPFPAAIMLRVEHGCEMPSALLNHLRDRAAHLAVTYDRDRRLSH
jgi:hypothetical protein